MQSVGFPKPSTNAFFVWSAPNACGMGFDIFSIQPASTTITFSSTNLNHSIDNVPTDEAVRKYAYEYAARFGLDRADLIPKEVYVSTNAEGGCDGNPTNGICVRGINFARKMDGISFFSMGNDNDGTEGFSIEFGSDGQIGSFSLVWPNLDRDYKSPTAGPQQIIDCIRAHRVLVIPNTGEEKYFQRVQSLTNAVIFTIVKITPYYGEGLLGDAPTNDEPPQIIAPGAELEAVAGLGGTNMNLRLLCPITVSEVAKFLKTR